jgi:hypothetical protein
MGVSKTALCGENGRIDEDSVPRISIASWGCLPQAALAWLDSMFVGMRTLLWNLATAGTAFLDRGPLISACGLLPRLGKSFLR